MQKTSRGTHWSVQLTAKEEGGGEAIPCRAHTGLTGHRSSANTPTSMLYLGDVYANCRKGMVGAR